MRILGGAEQRDLLLAAGPHLLGGGVPPHSLLADDAVLGMLHPAWQAVIAIALLVVTLLGIRRLAVRGPARVTSAVFFTGFLIVAITVIGTLVVSCSNQSVQRATTELRSPTP